MGAVSCVRRGDGIERAAWISNCWRMSLAHCGKRVSYFGRRRMVAAPFAQHDLMVRSASAGSRTSSPRAGCFCSKLPPADTRRAASVLADPGARSSSEEMVLSSVCRRAGLPSVESLMFVLDETQLLGHQSAGPRQAFCAGRLVRRRPGRRCRSTRVLVPAVRAGAVLRIEPTPGFVDEFFDATR